jgi:hypothetical protein
MHRLAPALVVLALAACRRSPDAQQSGQARYQGRPLAEWWQLRRDPDDAVEHRATEAMRMLGPAAVPFLAEKAASHDLGDMIGGSNALESLCPGAIPAMEAARSRYPSPALEGAIQRVRGRADELVQRGFCTAAGDPARPRPKQPSGSGGA